jgi:tetratricopeptide (TPR) repeat protein
VNRLVVVAVICEIFCGSRALAQAEQAHFQYERAVKMIDHGQYQQALACLNKSILLFPNYGALYEERGSLQLRMENRKAAEADLIEAVSLDPKLPKAHAELARCFFEEKKTADAIAQISKAIELEKRPYDKADRLCTRSTIYFRTGSQKSAFDDINAAIKLRPSLWIYAQRADMYYFNKNYQKALEDFTRILDWKNPESSAVLKRDDFLEFRARCYEKLGKTDLAKKDRLNATKELKKDPYFDLLTPTEAEHK